jgi:serine/threonine protein kinase
MTPEKLGRYEILSELGKGAMGVVYLARDPIIDRQLAIKTFRMAYSARDKEVEQFRKRFLREAQTVGKLSHPNIVTVHDVGDVDGDYFIAMEYIKGIDLKQKMQRTERLEVPYIVEVMAQIADGLGHAHSQGIVHRDVKPANILITTDEQAKITDFGIARIEQSNLTVAGQLLGTPNYMAPEQVQGRGVDARTDIFSLGVMLYELLTKKKPFQGENLTQVSHRIVYDEYTPPDDFVDNLSPKLLAVIERALQKVPDKRYQDAAVMAVDLRDSLKDAPEPELDPELALEALEALGALEGLDKPDEPDDLDDLDDLEELDDLDDSPVTMKVPTVTAGGSPFATLTTSRPTETAPSSTADAAALAEADAGLESTDPFFSEDEPPPPPPVVASPPSGAIPPSPTTTPSSAPIPPPVPSSSGPFPPSTPTPPAAPKAARPKKKAASPPAESPAGEVARRKNILGTLIFVLVVGTIAIALLYAGLLWSRSQSDTTPAPPPVDVQKDIDRRETELLTEADQRAANGDVESALGYLQRSCKEQLCTRAILLKYVDLAHRLDDEDDALAAYVHERMLVYDALLQAKQYEEALRILELVLFAQPDNHDVIASAQNIEDHLGRKRRPNPPQTQTAPPPPRNTPPPAQVTPTPAVARKGELQIAFRTWIAKGSVTVKLGGVAIFQESFAFTNTKTFKKRFLKGEDGIDQTLALDVRTTQLVVETVIQLKDGPVTSRGEGRIQVREDHHHTLYILIGDNAEIVIRLYSE